MWSPCKGIFRPFYWPGSLQYIACDCRNAGFKSTLLESPFSISSFSAAEVTGCERSDDRRQNNPVGRLQVPGKNSVPSECSEDKAEQQKKESTWQTWTLVNQYKAQWMWQNLWKWHYSNSTRWEPTGLYSRCSFTHGQLVAKCFHSVIPVWLVKQMMMACQSKQN